jgi:hypothetical protein
LRYRTAHGALWTAERLRESGHESRFAATGVGTEMPSQPERWPLLPYQFKPFKHNRLVAGLALRLLKLRTQGLERLIFTATTGRSGTLTLAKLFAGVPGCSAAHEANPVMNGPVLRAASYGDTALVDRVYRRVRSVNIRRAAVGYRYYFEGNHLFIKTFAHNAVADFGRRVAVVHLVRPAVEVANSIYQLGDYPGTERGNYWWLDYRASTNLISMADILESDPEFSHPFYKALWYWHEVEARIAAWRARMPAVQVVDFETRWLNDLGRVCGLLDGLGVQYERARLAPLVGAKEHTKDHQKIGTALPTQEAEQRAARFRELLEHLATKAPRRLGAGAAP